MILDLHIHSHYSPDSLATPERIIRTAKRKGLTGVAVTDHDTIRGGIETREANDDPNFLVIVGAEIATEVGDLIGLFLEREITSRTSMEVVDEIHAQGGIALLPHPFKGHRLNEEILRRVDLIEGCNARITEEQNRRAEELARQYGKPAIAGSDAHLLREIGTCRVHINGTDVRGALLCGEFACETGITPAYIPYVSQTIRAMRTGNYAVLPRYALTVVKKFLVGK